MLNEILISGLSLISLALVINGIFVIRKLQPIRAKIKPPEYK